VWLRRLSAAARRLGLAARPLVRLQEEAWGRRGWASARRVPLPADRSSVSSAAAPPHPCASTTAAAGTTSGRLSRRRRPSRPAHQRAERPRECGAEVARRDRAGHSQESVAHRPARALAVRRRTFHSLAEVSSRPAAAAAVFPALSPVSRCFQGLGQLLSLKAIQLSLPSRLKPAPTIEGSGRGAGDRRKRSWGPALAGSGAQFAHHRIVYRRSYLLDRVVRARRVHAVRQQHRVDRSIRINPQRRPGEACVAEGPRRHAAAA